MKLYSIKTIAFDYAMILVLVLILILEMINSERYRRDAAYWKESAADWKAISKQRENLSHK